MVKALVKSFSRFGFTLTEIMITLLITGVVASLTIPTIVNSTKEAEYYTSLKKAYSDLTQALNMAVAKNNGKMYVGTSYYSNPARTDFCNVMKCVKEDVVENIFYKDYYGYKSGSSGWPGIVAGTAAAVLSNGQLLAFYTTDNCNNYTINACGEIIIDINGMKGPNMWGKDAYGFHITYKNSNYALQPMGIPGDGASCNKDSWEDCTYLRLTNPAGLP